MCAEPCTCPLFPGTVTPAGGRGPRTSRPALSSSLPDPGTQSGPWKRKYLIPVVRGSCAVRPLLTFPEFGNTEALVQEGPQVRSEPLLPAISSTHPWMAVFYMRFCLETPHFIDTDSWTWNSQPTGLTLMPDWRWANVYFLHITDFLYSGAQNSILCSGVILNSKITNQKHKNVKNMAPNRPWKGPCLQYEHWKRGRRSLLTINWGHVRLDSTIFVGTSTKSEVQLYLLP